MMNTFSLTLLIKPPLFISGTSKTFPILKYNLNPDLRVTSSSTPASPFRVKPATGKISSSNSHNIWSPYLENIRNPGLEAVSSSTPSTHIHAQTSNGRPQDSSVSCSAVAELVPCLLETEDEMLETEYTWVSVEQKVRCIMSEFSSLVEPIDRVKRLLDYAMVLPEFDDKERTKVNKVNGCTVQVWVCVNMDINGRMRFSADSDSEITKGFCSCLVWILDRALPEEVVRLKSDDLIEMNIGLHGRSHSRVNTWHNVLIGMQDRTRDIVMDRDKRR